MAALTQEPQGGGPADQAVFVRSLTLFDGVMLVVGSMIGSGIFIVGAEIARQTGSPGALILSWVITGVLTVSAALSYGELSTLFPLAGGQYVYLREAYSPLFGFLYGWALLLVIQTGTIAAVAVGFTRYLGVLLPQVSGNSWILSPVPLSSRYALSLSVQQLVAILMVLGLTAINAGGVRLGKLIQNVFTTAKTLSLLVLILVCVVFARNSAAMADNFGHFWHVRGAVPIVPGTQTLQGILPTVSATSGSFGLLVAFCIAQVGSLFSADAWNNIGFASGEMKNPKRDVALSMAIGTVIATVMFCLITCAYLCVLTLGQIQNAPEDRVASAVLTAVFGPPGGAIMAAAIVISTFGCNNGLILAGARVTYAMARDSLFFKTTGRLNKNGVPQNALLFQCLWVVLLITLRTRHVSVAGIVTYGNLYSDLLDYVVFSVLLFYVLTVGGVFALRVKKPYAARPYTVVGYPFLPLLYMGTAFFIMIVLLLYRTETAWPGLLIVLLGIPVYSLWLRTSARTRPGGEIRSLEVGIR